MMTTMMIIIIIKEMTLMVHINQILISILFIIHIYHNLKIRWIKNLSLSGIPDEASFCQDGWQHLDEVQWGAKDDSPGAFIVANQSCGSKLMMVARGGGVTCDKRIDQEGSNFGCPSSMPWMNGQQLVAPFLKKGGKNGTTIVPTFVKENLVDKWGFSIGYELPGFGPESSFIELDLPNKNYCFESDDWYEIWYVEDLNDVSESDNDGIATTDVFICPDHNATSRRKREAYRQPKGKPGRDRYGEDYDMQDKMNPSAWLAKVVGSMLEKKRSMIMREEWRDNLMVQLGSCIYGDIWEGQVEEEDSGPLCNSMSKELRTRWKNIANNILQEVD